MILPLILESIKRFRTLRKLFSFLSSFLRAEAWGQVARTERIGFLELGFQIFSGDKSERGLFVVVER